MDMLQRSACTIGPDYGDASTAGDVTWTTLNRIELSHLDKIFL
jgi:hypothetical protein